MNDKEIIHDIIKKEIINITLVSNTSNTVYKVRTVDDEIFYVKFYNNNSSHIDNELAVYNIVDNKNLELLFLKN